MVNFLKGFIRNDSTGPDASDVKEDEFDEEAEFNRANFGPSERPFRNERCSHFILAAQSFRTIGAPFFIMKMTLIHLYVEKGALNAKLLNNYRRN